LSNRIDRELANQKARNDGSVAVQQRRFARPSFNFVGIASLM
jgi:hypothetical protein